MPQSRPVKPRKARTRRKPRANPVLQLLLLEAPPARAPLVVSDGLGVDSTAMLLLFHQLGIVPDLILHANTGGEHPETVAYIGERRRWLASVGFPDLTIVTRRPVVNGKKGSYTTLEGNCVVNETLPSLAYGYKSCSVKWKGEVMDRFVGLWEPAKRARAHGMKVRRAIGYDAGPKDARRSHIVDNDKNAYEYPLRVAGWDRPRCIAEILAAGIVLPRKSSCFFCPASKPWEIAAIVRDYPELADRIMVIEATAAPHQGPTVEGLWRKTVTGVRGGIARPGSMTEFILDLRANPHKIDTWIRLDEESAIRARRLPMVA